MLAWMSYAVTIALGAGLAAAALETALRRGDLPARGVWVAALIASILVPAAALLPDAAGGASGVLTLEVAEGIGETAAGLRETASGAAASLGLPLPDPDPVLAGMWGISSAVTLAWLGRSLLGLRRRLRAGRSYRAGEVTVHVAEDLGPAALRGPWGRPRVILPDWIRELDVGERRLVLEHEREHLRSGDPQLVILAYAAAAAAPWCLPLWWQVRRLRRAVELDCDRRVVGSGVEPAEYGDLLLTAGSLRSGQSLATPLFGSGSGLEARIRGLAPTPTDSRLGRAGLSLAVAVTAVVAAGSVPMPGSPLTAPDPSAAASANASPPAPASDGPDRDDWDVVRLDRLREAADGDTVDSLRDLAERRIMPRVQVEYRLDDAGEVREVRMLQRSRSPELNEKFRELAVDTDPTVAPHGNRVGEDVLRLWIVYNPDEMLEPETNARKGLE